LLHHPLALIDEVLEPAIVKVWNGERHGYSSAGIV
jgi:hypothetical protein